MNMIVTRYSLARRPLDREQKEEMLLRGQRGAMLNPFRWIPGSDNCSVCFDGLPGCPRCYMLPTKPDGTSYTPTDFGFDPEREIRVTRAREAVRIYQAMEEERVKKEQRALRTASLDVFAATKTTNDTGMASTTLASSQGLSSGGVGALANAEAELARLLSSFGDKGKEIHTLMTTEKSIRLYRSIILSYFTVYMKVLPGGHIRQLQIEVAEYFFPFFKLILFRNSRRWKTARFISTTCSNLIPTSEQRIGKW